MPNTAKLTLGPTHFVYDYFYLLTGGVNDETGVFTKEHSRSQRSGTLVSRNDESVTIDIVSYKECLFRECSLNYLHVTGGDFIDVEGEHNAGTKSHGFAFKGYGPESNIIDHNLLVRILRSDLSGFIQRRMRVEGLGDETHDDTIRGTWWDPSSPPDRRFYAWGTTDMCGAHSVPMLDPIDANSCLKCGHGPLICPECGEIDFECPRCGHPCLTLPCCENAIRDDIFVMKRDYPYLVIDPRRWNGHDAFAPAGAVTRRFVDFLFSIHAGPFVAVPIPTNVHGLTDEEWAKLERAKRPVLTH